MRRPNAQKKADDLQKQVARWVETDLKPYLQQLLDKAQAKCPKPIRFEQNQMFDHLWVGDDDLTLEDIDDYEGQYPELAEFSRLVAEADDALRDPWIGDINPRKHPPARRG